MEINGSFKRRRSRKRFDNIPPLPENLSVRTDSEFGEERATAYAGRRHSVDRRAVGGSTNNYGAEQRDLFPDETHDGRRDMTEVAECAQDAIDSLQGEWDDEERRSEDRNSEGDSFTSTVEGSERANLMPLENNVAEDGVYVEAPEKETFKSRITDWRVLWGVIMTSGVQKVTREQYQSIRAYMETSSNFISRSLCLSSPKLLEHLVQLPHYSTIQKRVKPVILSVLGPRSQELLVRVDVSKAGARKKSVTEAGKPQALVRIVMPSEYARADVSTPEVFSAMRDTSLLHAFEQGKQVSMAHLSTFECIDTIPLISSRDWFYGPPSSVNVDVSDCTGPYSTIAEAEDVIRISLLAYSPLHERIDRCFSATTTDSSTVHVSGIIQHIWTVNHYKRRSELDFSARLPTHLPARDKQIAKMLGFVTYTSPADSVSIVVPEPPGGCEVSQDAADAELLPKAKPIRSPEFTKAVRERRKALKQKRLAVENAWRNWKKPLIKPGDTVALLRPGGTRAQRVGSSTGNELLTSTDKQSRLCVVFRFWAEHEERSRHMLWIPGGADLGEIEERWGHEGTGDPSCVDLMCGSLTVDGCRYLNVSSIALASAHGGKRGPQKVNPTSSIGRLSTGEAYFVYRFLLYWDGFEVQSGKSATGEGIYLLCLNLPTQARSSPSAVRIVSLTPPGVKSASVLELILDDILEGMTSGFVDYDGFGTRRRIFLDLVGVIGDTPALNAVLDVLGHTGAACCHLCRIVRRSATTVGSRFTDQSYNGFVTAFRRSFYQHMAVRDCGTKSEACRGLGMKPDVDSGKLILHRMRAKMLEQSGKIPKTMQGDCVVPCSLDPYRAAFVAPDHVLTGHVRDCINLAFRLLPSTEHRVICEKLMASLLEMCKLPKQNRLVDHGKKQLHSMSMTEMYALSLVAEIGFKNGVSYANNKTSTTVLLSEKSIRAVELVGSASRLITKLWYLPRADRNGALEVKEFGRNYGWDYILKIQEHTGKHLALLEEICRFKDSEFNELEDPATSLLQKSNLSKIKNACVIAIRTVDKPNVHRIFELVNTTLPMLGHVSLFGELVLEKAHQSLKRAIRTSNNKEAHLQAMATVVLSDWQGRISQSAPLVYEENGNATRTCFRLLMGREAIISLKGQLSRAHRAQVLDALGPDNCTVTELQRQARSVLSTRYMSRNEENWRLQGFVQNVPVQSMRELSVSLSQHYIALSYFKDAFPLTWTTYTISISDSISSFIGSTLQGRVFRRGDVVQILTHYHSTSACHFPFLSQAHSSTADVRLDIGPSLWCIHSVISKTNAHGKEQFLLALFPCVEDVREQPLTNTYRVNTSSPISFATLDSSMRFVPSIHNCSKEECIYNFDANDLQHGTHSKPLDGACFTPLTSKAGYPPRMG